MGTVVFNLPDEEERRLRAKAGSLGLTTSAYLRALLRESQLRRPDAAQAEILRSLRAFVPTLAEAFGRTQNVSSDKIEKLAQVLLDRYDRAR